MQKSPIDGPQQPWQTIVLAHGAGAGMDSKFMQAMTEGLVGCGIEVARFEFPCVSRHQMIVSLPGAK